MMAEKTAEEPRPNFAKSKEAKNHLSPGESETALVSLRLDRRLFLVKQAQ